MKSLCGLCKKYFNAKPAGNGERYCVQRPVIKKVDYIIMESESCEFFEPGESFYCPELSYFMSHKTCLDSRRTGECPICTVGRAAVLLYRKRKQDV